MTTDLNCSRFLESLSQGINDIVSISRGGSVLHTLLCSHSQAEVLS
jgi:hypothetical protein